MKENVLDRQYIAAIDQGTTSTRCIIFDRAGIPRGSGQMEHSQIFPEAGWVEHDAAQIWRNTCAVVKQAMAKAGIEAKSIASIGITNQRETTVIWDKRSGKPLHNAIVWQDTRTRELVEKSIREHGSPDAFTKATGLPFSTYFSAFKIKWLMDNNREVAEAVHSGAALFGTMETWLIWNLTGMHVTDPTNASRTMLMNLHSLQWDEDICDYFKVPGSLLPQIGSCSEIYGYTKKEGPFGAEIPVAGAIGDQQAASLGQVCLAEGDAKNTYGTGCFMLLNTGTAVRFSNHGLLTTVLHRLGGSKPLYALEGSVAIAGALVQWLRDNLGIISSSSDIEPLARTVRDNGGIYFVPAFSGLYAPYWRKDARGVVAGLTRFVNKAHFARAALEATAYQTREIVDAMAADSGMQPASLRVDGGMVVNELLMQFQADLLGIPIIRPKVIETTALGAAYAAGLAVGLWKNGTELRDNWQEDKRWLPKAEKGAMDMLYGGWKKAVQRTLNWVDET